MCSQGNNSLLINTALLVLTISLSSTGIYANTVPVCAALLSDTDGDGWGWENNKSCLIDNTDNRLELGTSENPTLGIFTSTESQDFGFSLAADSSGNVYRISFVNLTLAANDASGNELWSTALPGSGFLIPDTSLVLDQSEENLLIGVSFSGVASYTVDGEMNWLFDLADPGEIKSLQPGAEAIIVFSTAQCDSIRCGLYNVYSVNYDGTLRWKYQRDSVINSVHLGNDGFVYIQLQGPPSGNERVYKLRQ